MGKIFSIALFGISLTLVGCIRQTPIGNQKVNQPTANQNQNTNQPTANANQNANMTDPAAKWQTYDGNLITFKFPNEFRITSGSWGMGNDSDYVQISNFPADKTDGLAANHPYYIALPENNIQISFLYYDNDAVKNLNLKEFANWFHQNGDKIQTLKLTGSAGEWYYGDYKSPTPVVVSEDEITVGLEKLPALKQRVNYDDLTLTYIFMLEKRPYLISMNPGNDSNEELIGQILSTFKFIK